MRCGRSTTRAARSGGSPSWTWAWCARSTSTASTPRRCRRWRAPTSRWSGTSHGPPSGSRRTPAASFASCPTRSTCPSGGGRPMIGDALVFDGVAHVFNFDRKNAFGSAGEMFSNHLYAFHQALTPANQTHLPPDDFLRQWTVSEIDRMVFEESDTDMLVAMPLPLTDLYRDGLSPWEECAELAARRPDRTVFWGS